MKNKNNHVKQEFMWKCVGVYEGKWCNFLMTNLEMQAHKFDLGCPRCRTPFSEFIKVEK